MRVVSLVPSVTETLLSWGVEPVAVTRFCEQPDLPTVGGTKNPDVAAIVALAPDLVVLDTEENRRPDAEALAAAGIELHVTAVRSVDDVAATLQALAARLGVEATREATPEPLVEPLPSSSGPSRTAPDVVAFVPIWRRPWMTLNGSTYASTLLGRLGVGNAFADAADPYPVVELDAVAATRPDLALLPTEPYAFDTSHAEELSAALGVPARIVDGKDLFWWGVRTPAALARLGAQAQALRVDLGRTAP